MLAAALVLAAGLAAPVGADEVVIAGGEPGRTYQRYANALRGMLTGFHSRVRMRRSTSS